MSTGKDIPLVDFWLGTATSALCHQARARIAVEIRAHYSDLVAAHITEGMSLEDARFKALDDLGDAEVAARRFRKHHLTKNDERVISNILKVNGGITRIFSSLFVAFMVFVILLVSRFRIGLDIAFFLIFGAFPTTAGILARRVKGENGITAALLSDMTTRIACGLYLTAAFASVAMGWGPPLLFWLLIFLMILIQFYNFIFHYRLWKKFRGEQKRRGEVLKAS